MHAYNDLPMSHDAFRALREMVGSAPARRVREPEPEPEPLDPAAVLAAVRRMDGSQRRELAALLDAARTSPVLFLPDDGREDGYRPPTITMCELDSRP